MTQPTDDAKRFSELLPFYVNQTLNAADQAWMEHQLSDRPPARQALQLELLLSHTVRNTRSQVPESERLANMLAALADARRSPKAQAKASWFGLGGLSRGLAWGARLAIPVPAVMALCIVLLGQALYIARSHLPEANTQAGNAYRGAAQPCADQALLRVQIKADAKMEDIVLLLRKAGATLKAGPSETGEVWVSIAPERAIEEARTVLKASAITEDVMALPAAPATEGCAKK
jgi:hypothetical protein